MKYIKKPIPVEISEPWVELCDMPDIVLDYMIIKGHGDSDQHCSQCGEYYAGHGWCKTLEGGHIVCSGDRIVTGVMGEKYPIKPNIFEETYEQAGNKGLS